MVTRPPEPADRSGDGSGQDRLTTVRRVVIIVWAVLLVVRLALTGSSADANLTLLGIVQALSIVAGVLVVGIGLWTSWARRRRLVDDALGAAIRGVDPTVRLVPAAPTAELAQAVVAEHPDVQLDDRMMWGFGATDASLWQLDGRRAVRVLVVPWSRVVHVGVEDDAGADGRGGAVLAMHYVRPDDTAAVVTFAVRLRFGSSRALPRGPRLEQLAAELAGERHVGP